MNRMVIAILIFCMAVEAVWARGYEIERKLGDYQVVIKLDKNTPVVGDNRIQIDIKDPSGRSFTDAEVLINYYMPPMPRMAPMNYTIGAALKGQSYMATMNFIMAGPWYIAVILKHGNKTFRTRFNVDAQ